MHASSFENMQQCYEEFLGRSSLLDKPSISVLDIGGSDVNGSYREIFSNPKFNYTSVDLEEGPGVDVVLNDPYHLPFSDSEFDIVLSGQCFEHAEFFWKIFEEMVRVLNCDGLIFLIAPSAGPIHRYPVDCYRFYPDSMYALAKYTNTNVIDCWLDDRGPWNDLVAVFSHDKVEITHNEIRDDLPLNFSLEVIESSKNFNSGFNPAVDIVSGKMHYLDFLKHLHHTLAPNLYLEIGVRKGRSLELANCRSIGVDPCAEIDFELALNKTVYSCTSDYFFDRKASDVLSDSHLDLVFIDGMHLFEYALRDFINIEKYSSPSTLVVIDDIFPNHPLQAERMRQSMVWTGDIWKLHKCLQETRPDLNLLALDTEPTGLLLLRGLNPENHSLRHHYNPIVRKYGEMTLENSVNVLGRENAINPKDPAIQEFLRN